MALDTSAIERRREQRRAHARQLCDQIARRNVTPGPDPDRWDVFSGHGLPSGWADDHGLELPALVLAVDASLATDEHLVRFDPARRWLLLAHQYAGVGCRQLRLVATPLVPAPGVAAQLAELARRHYDSSLGAFTPNALDEVIDYRDFLRDRLDVDCRLSYPHLAEAVYPIDPTADHLARLTDEQLPADLDDLLEFSSQVSSMLGTFNRWSLLVLAENSD